LLGRVLFNVKAFCADYKGVRIFVLALLALGLVGCETVTLSGGSAPSRGLQLELKQYFPRAQWRFFDHRYEPVPAASFFNSFLPEFKDYLRMRGIRGVTSGFSEKQYAEIFKIQLDLWLQRTLHKNVQPACGLLLTDQSHLRANDLLPSAWIVVQLDQGWVVVHPISFKVVRLDQFQYRGTISAVHF